ncbi:chromosome segregation protein [Caloramator mitchellensis]|uniref:Chromosome segregation protein n=1 Tax=Caloramator mitchellensis TaxID=908809 RepID=A0A0R3JTX9_CALMK|nr:ATPase [Caloramator mitchellensis]KRQ87011.1 chromosome segregation protein [Caloramator mitchellensis]
MYDDIIAKYSQDLENEYKNYYIKEGIKQNLLLTLKEQNEKLIQIEDELERLRKVKVLLKKTSEFAREQSKSQMEYLITQCLQYIFDGNIEFKIELREKADKIDAEFYVVSNHNGTIVATKPQEARGGGVVDIISLAIRVAMMEIHSPKIEGPLVLDEPAKHVSDDYIVNVAEFIKNLSDMFNRQVIMVTHNVHLLENGDYVYRVTLNNGISQVEQLKGSLT